MKKFIALILTICFSVGMLNNFNYFVYAQEISGMYTVEPQEYTQSQINQLKSVNYVFSQEELKNTPYEGKHVEIIEGQLYVDKSIVWTVIIWFLSKGYPILAGWMASGGVIKAANNQIIKSELKVYLRGAQQRFSNMTDAYCENQQLKSIRLSNGNECVPRSATTYVCKFSVE